MKNFSILLKPISKGNFVLWLDGTIPIFIFCTGIHSTLLCIGPLQRYIAQTFIGIIIPQLSSTSFHNIRQLTTTKKIIIYNGLYNDNINLERLNGATILLIYNIQLH